MKRGACVADREAIGRVGQRRQVVIPKSLCEALSLREGDFVAFQRREGGVLIRPKRLVDPDDALSTAETALLRKAERQMREGRSVALEHVKDELARKPGAGSRKTA